MTSLAISRAAAWLGVVVVGWSLNVRWGAETALGSGPPVQLERPVQGALLLAVVLALALSIGGRGWISRGLALAAGAGALAIALWVRSSGPDSALGGPGWPWLIAGVALALAGVAIAAAQKAPAKPEARRGRRRRR